MKHQSTTVLIGYKRVGDNEKNTKLYLGDFPLWNAMRVDVCTMHIVTMECA